MDLWIQDISLTFGLKKFTLGRVRKCGMTVIGQAVTSILDKMWRIVWSVSPNKELKRNDNSHTLSG